MSKKFCLNPKCGKGFTPKNPKGKYCSDACRSSHQYQLKVIQKQSGLSPAIPSDQKKKIIKLKSIDPTLVVASEIKSKPKPGSVTPVYPAWVKEIEDYCNKAGCTHKDLITAHKNIGDQPSMKKVFGGKKEKKKPVAGESYMDRRRKAKMGLGG